MTDSIPDFDQHGNLPPGTYLTYVEDIQERYRERNNLQRDLLTTNLLGFLDFLKETALHAFINGSYITTNIDPSDVDVLVVLPEDFKWESDEGARLSQYIDSKKIYKLDIHPFVKGKRVGKLHEMIKGWTKSNDIAHRPKGILIVEFQND